MRKKKNVYQKSQHVLVEALIQDLSWLRAFVAAYFFSAGRVSFRGFKGSRPLLDVPSQDVLGAVNPNEPVAGPHSPSTSGASRPVWGSPTVARSFISAAAVPFFMCDSLGACSRRRTIVTSRHLVKFFSIHCSFFSFLSFGVAIFVG